MTGSSEPSPQQLLATALDARLGPNGEIDKQLALDMFAAVYGGGDELGATPLPGAVEATTALMLTMQVWDQLTPDQQQVIEHRLDLPVASSETINATGDRSALLMARKGTNDTSAHSNFLMRSSDPSIQVVEAQVERVGALWGSALGRDVRVDVMNADLPPPDNRHSSPLADALPMQRDGRTAALTLDDYSLCRVRLYPAFMRKNGTDQIATAAHEIFHCFQFTIISLNDSVRLRSGQLWVIEGQAEWVGATVAGGGEAARGWWRQWLTREQKLWRRDYDAIGFYASLARHGVNPWTVFRPMLELGAADFASMYAAATPGLTRDFLAQVAVDHASEQSIGDPWLPVGPGATPVVTDEPEEVLTESWTEWPIEVGAYDFNSMAVNVADDVVTVRSDKGPWALGGAGVALTFSGPARQSGCVRSGECLCPDGLALDIPQLATNGRVAVGVTFAEGSAGSSVVSVRVDSVPLATACATMPHRTPSVLGCMVGQWTLSSQTVGDRFIPGLQGIHYRGGIAGRHLDIAPNGAYVMTDDGSGPVTGRGRVGGIPVDVRVTSTGRVEGTVERASPSTATFASNTASIDVHVHENVGGAPVDLDHHFDDAAYFGNGEATVTCDGNTMTTVFPNATFAYTRG